jgi:hypothetical protein
MRQEEGQEGERHRLKPRLLITALLVMCGRSQGALMALGVGRAR